MRQRKILSFVFSFFLQPSATMCERRTSPNGRLQTQWCNSWLSWQRHQWESKESRRTSAQIMSRNAFVSSSRRARGLISAVCARDRKCFLLILQPISSLISLEDTCVCVCVHCCIPYAPSLFPKNPPRQTHLCIYFCVRGEPEWVTLRLSLASVIGKQNKILAPAMIGGRMCLPCDADMRLLPIVLN
jgi:hypothetical protein